MRTARFAILLGILAACGGNERGRKSPPIEQVALSSVSVSLSLATAEVGAALKATAMGTYADGNVRDVSTQVAWSSSDINVATVGTDGTITPLALGVTTITATLRDQTASAQLTVTPAGDPVVSLTLTPSPANVEIGSTLQMSLNAVLQSGQQLDVTGGAQWSVSDPTLASVDAGVVTGLAAGVVVVNATYGEQVQSAGVTVREPIRLGAIELSATTLSLDLAGTQQLTATGVLTDGNRMDVTSMVTWTSSNPAIASVSATGLVTGVAIGNASITAMMNNVTAAASVTVQSCAYPQAGNRVALGGVLPPVSWTGAFDRNGATADFAMEDFYCDSAYDNYSSVLFVIGAGWCPNCPDYKRRVESAASQVAAAGGLIVWVEIENNSSQPASHSEALQIVNRSVPNADGLRIGDGETIPAPSIFGRAVNAVPGAFVVRKSDMMVIADQGQSSTYLDFAALARDAANGGGTPTSNCMMGDEESFEPNDSPQQAGSITVPADVSGGICNAESDFYRVNGTGAWTANLTFSNATGDLDIYVIDESTGMVMTDAMGNPIGSESTTDNESFSHSGSALIVVVGYQGATAPYRLTIN